MLTWWYVKKPLGFKRLIARLGALNCFSIYSCVPYTFCQIAISVLAFCYLLFVPYACALKFGTYESRLSPQSRAPLLKLLVPQLVKKFPLLLSSKVPNRFQKCPSLVPLVSHFNPDYAFLSYLRYILILYF
jgi:hypothetical protein